MSERLRVNPIACTGHGLCAELFPERVWLDEWGYPVIEDGELSGELLKHARRAVDACPVLALRLEAQQGRAAAGSQPAGRAPRQQPAGGRR
jgi:ferredoxin